MVAIILAAGVGKRMCSKYPKALFKILGKEMIDYTLEKLCDRELIELVEKVIVVVGSGADVVKAHVISKNYPKPIEFVEQREPLGTAHALLQTEEITKKYHKLLVLPVDLPLLKKETILNLIKSADNNCDINLISAKLKNPCGWGRIIRTHPENTIKKIIEESDLSEDQKKINEVNVGVYIFKREFIYSALTKIKPTNKQKEYYLTDVVEIADYDKRSINSLCVEDEWGIIGVNTRADIVAVEEILKRQKYTELLERGVQIIDPTTTYIHYQVKINKDVVIYPNTIILGDTIIEEDSLIGPYTYLLDCKIGKAVEIIASFVKDSVIEDNVKIGPFAHIRPQVLIKKDARIGNFVELKNSSIGEKTKIMHLTYVGDSDISREVNVGAGTITCNYDGIRKHKTYISEGVFIGSNTALIAPVNIGRGAVIGAGSTITKDVPEYALAIGRARQKNINGWALKRLDEKKS